MKCALKMVVFPALVIFYSMGMAALNHEQTNQDLSRLRLRSGVASPQNILTGAALDEYYKAMHKEAFVASLAKIARQSDKFNNKQVKKSRQTITQTLLPDSFNRPQILALAESLEFSADDDLEARARKYLRLALLIRDMYDPDNNLSKNLNIDLMKPRLSHYEIVYFVTESYDHAVNNLALAEESIDDDSAIDFHLSYAQILLSRLTYGRQSLVHLLGDFEVEGDQLVLNTKSKQLHKEIIRQLDRANKAILNNSGAIPPIYHKDMAALIASLTDDEKFDLIQMHKAQVDKEREEERDDMFKQLQSSRGLAATSRNPLDDMTQEKVDIVRIAGRSLGKDGNELSSFVYQTMKNYALLKVKSVEKYFSQDVLQRYLIESGKISRMQLNIVLLETSKRIRDAAARIEIN